MVNRAIRSDIRLCLVLSDGLGSRGGIGRIMSYCTRELERAHPDIEVEVQRTRLSTNPVLKHLTVPLALCAFAWRCALGRIDIAHINVARRGSTWRKLLFAAVARTMGCKVVLHLHGSGYDAYYRSLPAWQRNLISRGFNAADAVIALSPWWRDVLVEQMKVRAQLVTVIANGVPDKGCAADEERMRGAGDEAVICFAGEIGPRKGTDVLLQALADCTPSPTPWRAILAGNGAVDDARRMAEGLEVSDRIAFPGWVREDEMDLLLADAHVFVLPSRAENQPAAIIEAMARALPVVATRVGGIPEQVEDGKTGLLVEPGDAAGLGAALSNLIENPHLSESMGRAGRARYLAHYSVEACVASCAALYRCL